MVAGDSLRGDICSYRLPERGRFIFVHDCVAAESAIGKLAGAEYSEIVLVQYDCYVSQIWQLTMQAYIEKFEISDHIKRICFYDGESDFRISRIDEIKIVGSYDAYCQLVCKHMRTELSQYLIDAEAVEYYLDIYSQTGKLRHYICQTSAKYDSPYDAYGVFCRDYPLWGLGDREFMMIAMETFSKDPQFAETAKRWKRILKKRKECLLF